MRYLLLFLLAVSARAQLFDPHLTLSRGVVVNGGGGGGGSITINTAWKGTGSAAANVITTVAPTAGHALVVCVVSYSGDFTSCADNIDGTTGWNLALKTNSSATYYCAIYYKFNIPSGITRVTNVSAGAYLSASVHDVTGITAFTSTEKAAIATSGTSLSVGSVANGTSPSVFFACGTDGSGSNPATWTVNATGSAGGTWSLFNTSNCQELDGVNLLTMSAPSLVVSSGVTATHVWTIENVASAAVMACFH